MKKVSMAAAAFALTSLFSVFASPAMANEVDLKACMKDGKTAILKVDVEGSAQTSGARDLRPLESVAQEALTKAAGNIRSVDLTTVTERRISTVDPLVMAFQQNMVSALKGKGLSPNAHIRLLGPPTTGEPGCSAAPAQFP